MNNGDESMAQTYRIHIASVSNHLHWKNNNVINCFHFAVNLINVHEYKSAFGCCDSTVELFNLCFSK